MTEKHLGETIDIHGGGNDLIFPHHENELAQSTCAHGGQTFARFWLHNGFLNVDSTKMSKSLGNVLLMNDLLKEYPGEVIRLALLSAHYRQPLDWTTEAVQDARRKLDRLYGALREACDWESAWQSAAPDATFLEAMHDDLNTPRALAALFDLARDINRSADAQEQRLLAIRLRGSAEILGLLQSPVERWFKGGDVSELSDEEVERLLQARRDARARKDFAEADCIRDQLTAAGIMIEDGATGTRWRRS